MKIALFKKRFRLAVKLLKFKVCKAFLNSKAPADDKFFILMNKNALEEKNKFYDNLAKEKLFGAQLNNENRENYLKLLSMQSDSKAGKNGVSNDTIKEAKNMIDDELEQAIDETAEFLQFKRFKTIVGNKKYPELIPKQTSLDDSMINRLKSTLNNPLNSVKKSFNTMVDNLNKFITKKEATSQETSKNNTYRKSVNEIKELKEEEVTETPLKEILRQDEDILNNLNHSKNLSLYRDNQSVKSAKLRSVREESKTNISMNQSEKAVEEVKNLAKGIFAVRVVDQENNQVDPRQINNQKSDFLKSLHSAFNNENSGVEDINTINNADRRKSVYGGGSMLLSGKEEARLNSSLLEPGNFEDSDSFMINVQMVLIDHLRWGQFTYYILCLLNSIPDRYIMTEYSDKICKYFLVFTRDEDGVSRCRYPILVCAMAAEFMLRIAKLNLKYQYKCRSVAELLIKLGESLQSAIKDEEMLHYYLREQVDQHKRSALEIIAENRFYLLLKDENVAAIVSKLWYGSGKDKSLWNFSRITRILGANIKHEHYVDVISNVKDLSHGVYSFQFDQYISNCSFRYLVDSMSTIFTTILYQILVYFYVNIKKQNKDPIKDPDFHAVNYLAGVIVNSMNFNLIMYMVYVAKTNRKIKFSGFLILDIVMFTSVLLNFLDAPNLFFDGYAYIAEEKADDVSLQTKKDFVNAALYSFIIFCAWIRVIGILMTTRSFGPFLRIIWLLLWSVANFLLIFFAFNTVFAQIFTLLFKNSNEDFKSFFDSWITLFNASFGQYDFSGFNTMVIFGYVLLIAYTTVTNVMLLNLIIAIINNKFNDYQKQADAENRAVLVLTYERIKWDNDYGLLILLPAPFNIIAIPFLIILLIFTKDQHRANVNLYFSKICYFIIAAGMFLFFLFGSIMLFPLAYLKSLFHSSYDDFGQFKLKEDFPKPLIAICTRPLKLLQYFFEDLLNYWRIVYVKSSNDSAVQRQSIVNKDIILAFRKVLLDYKYKNKKKIITMDELYRRLGLNKRLREPGLLREKGTSMSSINNGNVSDNSGDSNENNAKASSFTTQNNPTDPARLSNVYFNTGGSQVLSRQITHLERDAAFMYLVDKMVDKELYVDVDRTLLILPQRVKYTQHFIDSLHFMNMRFILRGLRNFFFVEAVNNPVYSYKKLQQMIYKILIKFKMVYNYIPESVIEKIGIELNEVNKNQQYSKSYEILRRLEENDEFSDYDDQGDYNNFMLANLNNKMSEVKKQNSNSDDPTYFSNKQLQSFTNLK
jgi:hypothetical protein